MPQQWKYAIVMVLYKNKDRTECGSYGDFSLVAHAGKKLLKIIARRLSEYCEGMEILPKEQSGFQPNRSITDMIFMPRLQTLVRRNEFHRICASSTLRKRTTPLTEPSSGQYPPGLACHKI